MTLKKPHVTSVGQLLSDARSSLGLELRDVAERTRLSIQVLEAIERDDWAALSAPVYARGFVKLYAEAVGIDSKGALALFARTQKQVEPEAKTAEGAQSAVSVGSARRTVHVERVTSANGIGSRLAAIFAVLLVVSLLGWLSFGGGLDEEGRAEDDLILGVSSE